MFSTGARAGAWTYLDMTGIPIFVADLLHQPGARRHLQIETPLAGLENRAARVEGPVAIDVVLERVSDGIVVHGTVAVHWEGACSRCLTPVAHDLEVGVRELFEATPLEGDTYLLAGVESGSATVDLADPIRDAVLTELPAVPLCRDDCLGLCPECGADRNTTECDCETDEADPRWAVLSQLEL